MSENLATIALALAFLTAGAGDSSLAILATLTGVAVVFAVASQIMKGK